MPLAQGAPTREHAFASELWRVPPLPGALARLLAVAHDDNSELADVAEAVALDEVLAAHIMRAANSALLGFRATAKNVQQAVARIGCTTVLSVAVAQALSGSARLARNIGGIPRVSYWEHNWAVATAASILGPVVGLRPAEAHLAGLLHDMGKLLLASREPGTYEDCIAQAAQTGASLRHTETRFLGLDHTAAGAAALAAWQMPELAVLAAERHHDRAACAASPVVGVVGTANLLAHEARLGDSGNPSWPSPFDHPELRPRLPDAALRRCLAQLERESCWLKELAAQFSEA